MRFWRMTNTQAPYDKQYNPVFEDLLLQWWYRNGRFFPWRATRDAYAIMIAEIMLHRTRAEQVERVYGNFLDRFPNLEALCKTNWNDVDRTMDSLGLKWRTTMLKELCEVLVSDYSSQIPLSKDLLKSLPGIGDYISSAIRCFSLNAPEVLIDTNTVRIAARILGLIPKDSLRRDKKIFDFYLRTVSIEKPREFYFALIDLGAQICKASIMKCDKCPIGTVCETNKRRNR